MAQAQAWSVLARILQLNTQPLIYSVDCMHLIGTCIDSVTKYMQEKELRGERGNWKELWCKGCTETQKGITTWILQTKLTSRRPRGRLKPSWSVNIHCLSLLYLEIWLESDMVVISDRILCRRWAETGVLL